MNHAISWEYNKSVAITTLNHCKIGSLTRTRSLAINHK